MGVLRVVLGDMLKPRKALSIPEEALCFIALVLLTIDSIEISFGASAKVPAQERINIGWQRTVN